MPYKERAITQTIFRALKTFPAVVLTGPRQSGKTTLLKKLFSKTHRWVTLEDSHIRSLAKNDPVAFLEENPPPLILDEIQYVPELLSYIKTKIDENRRPGQWLLTGSQNFALMKDVSQSLAGRAAVLSLLPLAFSEFIGAGKDCQSPEVWMKGLRPSNLLPKKSNLSPFLLRGGFPEIASNKRVDRQIWCSSYITTYLERDVRNLSNIGDLNQFDRFIRACAARTGQILNLSQLASDLGISVPTAKRWISILEAGYQIFLLYPYYRNIGKRLFKSPKLYFTDTGLASYLLGIHHKDPLMQGPSFGPLFETMIISDFLKRFYNAGLSPAIYYIQTRDKLEVDLVIEMNGKLNLFEIKATSTMMSRHASSLIRLENDSSSQIEKSAILSRSPKSQWVTKKIYAHNWEQALRK